ncbi:site-specific integrase [Roseateles asaccharophilus]|uniref:Integrase n=1 Tax=Roseateles asaccharophilus TaxID=582607 RepID=A0ABU2ABD3_9BURK|nr:site-specific integrase [Roseateles asaccharophilus]MDR7334508.1 integrase [Roseateles asaccharophilus]
MGTIVPRKRADGSVGYTAQIRIKRGGRVVHSEAETFERDAAARAWMKKREAELAQPGALDPKPEIKDPLLSEIITQYNTEKLKEHGKTKTQVLKTIQESRLGGLRGSQIGSKELVEWVRDELDATPQTRGNYVAHLSSVFVVTRPAWGYPLDPQAMSDAKIVMKKLGLISRSKERNRRPTLAELDKIMAHYEAMQKRGRAIVPMNHIILFAIFSTRRQEEITRIAGADLDADHKEVIVRDMKNPGEKIGNDVRTTLTPEALRLIQLQPETKGSIWPYNAESISTSFRKACDFLGIEDLHFHDLRHDGISRLFELGWNIPQVAQVSGHKSWSSLKRYTHIRQSGDKYAGWSWRTKILDSD